MAKFSLSQIRLTAAEILSAAVMEYACKAYRVSGGELPWGFYYDFVFNTPFSEDMLLLIEERMRQIASKNLQIKIHEMTSKNAVDYLRYHRHFYAAHFTSMSLTSLVQVFQMEEFIDRVNGQCLPNSGELKNFKLLGISQRPDLSFRGDKKKVFRIYGTAFHDKEALKAFLHSKKKWLENNHLILGEKMGLFTVRISRAPTFFEKAELIWRGEGEKVLHSFKELWRKMHLKEGFELIQTMGIDMSKSHQNFYSCSDSMEDSFCIAEMRPPLPGGEINPLEGFFTAENVHRDCASIFCSKKHLREKIILSLKFLEKIPKMFHLKSKSILSFSLDDIEKKLQKGKEEKMEWILQDGHGHPWKSPCLSVKKWGEVYRLQWRAYFSLERMIALILENGEKDLSQKKEILSKIISLDE